MTTTALFTRKKVLQSLGFRKNASRSSWSHDDGRRIYFDAWTNRYAPDGRYPMSTQSHYPRTHDHTQRGLTMWLAHLDLVLSGQREAVLINPVPREPGPNQGASGAKGWLPRYTIGQVVQENGETWFVPEKICALDDSERESKSPDDGRGIDELPDLTAVRAELIAQRDSLTRLIARIERWIS